MYLDIKNQKEKYPLYPSKIIAMGLNYHNHIAENESLTIRGFNSDIPQEPVLFPKSSNALTGHEKPIILPAILDEYHFPDERTDYEGELAVILSRECKNIKKEDAYDYILGYTIANDVSQRNIQNKDPSGWYRGKSFDTFLPIGPILVQKEELPNVHQLRLTTKLNGKIVQDANTSEMIFNIPEIISFLSKNFTLFPGDIILTGTPGGVGPIKEGDLIEVTIEGIGTLRNFVLREKRGSL